MSPRPTRQMLHEFFEKSKGLKYWNLKLVKGSVSRRKHIYLPLIRWIEESLELLLILKGFIVIYILNILGY